MHNQALQHIQILHENEAISLFSVTENNSASTDTGTAEGINLHL